MRLHTENDLLLYTVKGKSFLGEVFLLYLPHEMKVRRICSLHSVTHLWRSGGRWQRKRTWNQCGLIFWTLWNHLFNVTGLLLQCHMCLIPGSLPQSYLCPASSRWRQGSSCSRCGTSCKPQLLCRRWTAGGVWWCRPAPDVETQERHLETGSKAQTKTD